MPISKPAIFSSLQWRNRLAQTQRNLDRSVDKAKVVAVAAMDDNSWTNALTGLISLLVNAESSVPVVIIDADGINQPLRQLLETGDKGDLSGLANHPKVDLDRKIINAYADQSGRVPLITAAQHLPEEISAADLEHAVHRAQHHWPTVVINLPNTCPPDTISAGVSLANHVLLITGPDHEGHEWLYQPGHQLSELAAKDAVTVLSVGNTVKDITKDTLPVPNFCPITATTKTLTVPTDAESLTVFHRILDRIYQD